MVAGAQPAQLDFGGSAVLAVGLGADAWKVLERRSQVAGAGGAEEFLRDELGAVGQVPRVALGAGAGGDDRVRVELDDCFGVLPGG